MFKSFYPSFPAILLLILASSGTSIAAPLVPAADGPQGLNGVKTWAQDRIRDAEASFGQSGLRRQPSPGFWGDEVVYQIQVDRFNSSDALKPKFGTDYQTKNEGITDQGLQNYRHGGDLQGIIDRLGYLKELGVTTLWITPIFRNGDGSYHGYCTSDFAQVDPGFGTNELFRQLVAQAHAAGIRVVLDIVVNHMCDTSTRYDDVRTPFSSYYYGRCVDTLNQRYWSGNQALAGQRDLLFGPSFFPLFRSPFFFSRCGNQPGDFSGEGAGAMFGDFSPLMFDFDTNNHDFQQIFIDLHKWWIAYSDVDGFRLDAAKHVTADFVANFSTQIRAYAASLGKQNFFLVGEVAAAPFEEALRLGRMRSNINNPAWSSGIPATLQWMLSRLSGIYLANPTFPFPGLNAVYDFAQSGSIVNFWHTVGSARSVKNGFFNGGETDNFQCADGMCELSANGDPRLNWNILEIHDWPRFALWKASPDQMVSAFGHLATTVGTPVLYYGFEQGLNGDCHWDTLRVASSQAKNEILGVCGSADVMNHARYRQDMFVQGKWRLGSQVPEINSLAGIGYPLRTDRIRNWRDDPYLRTEHSLFKGIQRLIAIRKSCSALRYGKIYFRAAHSNPAGGLLAFSRIDAGIEMLVLLNSSRSSIPLNTLVIDGGLNTQNGSVWKNLLNDRDQAWVGDFAGGKGLYFANGFQVAPNSAAIFVDAGNISEFDAKVGAFLCRK